MPVYEQYSFPYNKTLTARETCLCTSVYNRNHFTRLCALQFIVRHSLLRRDSFLMQYNIIALRRIDEIDEDQSSINEKM